MPTSTQPEACEAELVMPVHADRDVNPFASPELAANQAVEISNGIGRSSQDKIDRVNRRLVQAEISYVALWITFIVTSAIGPSFFASGRFGLGISIPGLASLSEFGLWIWVASMIVAWIAFTRLVIAVDEFDLTSLLMVVCFPLPGIGFLTYFAGKKFASRFLTWNGYLPGFLGAKPNEPEIALMNSNPLYRPSSVCLHDGSRRQWVWSLSDTTVGLFIVLSIATWIVVPFMR